MVTIDPIYKDICYITDKINNSPQDVELHLERAKLYLQSEQFDKALNDFIVASEIEPNNREIKEHITMIKSIFNYRNIDIYNP